MDALTADLGDDVYAIDTQMHGYAGITAGYLIRGERPCLVETGTARSAPAVVAALDALGIGRQDLATIVVTHIHLDHAGGVGDLARTYPGADVVVHERGARHLADPERLLRSSRMVYGDALDTLFGELLPVPAERLRALGERGRVDLGGGRELSTYHSPGHAQHHVGLLDSATGDLYVGDAAGIYIPDVDTLLPGTPPPDFDLEQAISSLALFAALAPSRLLFSHFGPLASPAEGLERAQEELRLWVDLVRDARAEDPDADHAVAMVLTRTQERYAALRERTELAARFEQLNATSTNVAGITRWLDRVEQETALG